MGIMVRVLLAESARNNAVSDAVAITTLRCFENQSPPKSDLARVIYDSMVKALSDESVSQRAIRESARELVDLAKRYDDKDDPDCFLKYLEVLAD